MTKCNYCRGKVLEDKYSSWKGTKYCSERCKGRASHLRQGKTFVNETPEDIDYIERLGWSK